VVLVGLIAVVYGSILPGVRSTTLELFLGVAVIIVFNAAFTLALAAAPGRRRRWRWRSSPTWS
jgi:membrane protein YdbS with pleckstrin-like domain